MKEKLELRDHRVSHGTIPSVTKWEAWPYHLHIVWTISPGNPVEWVEKTHELSEIQQQKGCKTRTWGYVPKLMVNFVFLQKIVSFLGERLGRTSVSFARGLPEVELFRFRAWDVPSTWAIGVAERTYHQRLINHVWNWGILVSSCKTGLKYVFYPPKKPT